MRKGDLDLLDAVNDDVFELSDRSGISPEKTLAIDAISATTMRPRQRDT